MTPAPAPTTRHRLGFAVKVLAAGGLPSHDARRWQSGPHLRTSLEHLTAILAYLDDHDIRMYRMATALAPYASHPDLPQFHGQIEECAEELADVGRAAREAGIRLSTHPGQYTVLNSERPDVVDAAVAELEVQAAVMDAMGLEQEAVVVLHVGGTAGGLPAAADRFAAGAGRLSDAARGRLVLENDDRSFGVVAVTELARRTGVRVVFDLLHHQCHDPDGVPDHEAAALACSTWPDDQVPKLHFSSPRLDLEEKKTKEGRRLVQPQLRAHADLLDPLAVEHLLRHVVGRRDVDIMLEAKGKDLALDRLRGQLAARGMPWRNGAVEVTHDAP